jgi:hypothetical protein
LKTKLANNRSYHPISKRFKQYKNNIEVPTCYKKEKKNKKKSLEIVLLEKKIVVENIL